MTPLLDIVGYAFIIDILNGGEYHKARSFLQQHWSKSIPLPRAGRLLLSFNKAKVLQLFDIKLASF